MVINFKILQNNIVLLANFLSIYCSSSSFLNNDDVKPDIFKPDEDLQYID